MKRIVTIWRRKPAEEPKVNSDYFSARLSTVGELLRFIATSDVPVDAVLNGVSRAVYRAGDKRLFFS